MIVAEEEWLTRQEAVKRAGVHYNVIREWEEKGYINSRKDGTAPNSPVLIEISSLDRHLMSRHTPVRLSDVETKLAALEAENRELRKALSKSEDANRELQKKQDRLLERILRLAERE